MTNSKLKIKDRLQLIALHDLCDSITGIIEFFNEVKNDPAHRIYDKLNMTVEHNGADEIIFVVYGTRFETDDEFDTRVGRPMAAYNIRREQYEALKKEFEPKILYGGKAKANPAQAWAEGRFCDDITGNGCRGGPLF